MMFSENDKIRIFDNIYSMYFNANFGSISKSDFELMLFSEFLNERINNKQPYDDYTLSKILGITQTRVRSLKERKELKYPYITNDWKQIFAESVKNAKYDKDDHHVKINVEDVNVLNEVRHYIESKGWYDEYSLNRKLLNISLACFTDIFVDDKSISELFTKDAEKKIKAIANQESSFKNFVGDFTKDGLKSFLMSASKTTISAVLECIPFGGFAKTAFGLLCDVIKNV